MVLDVLINSETLEPMIKVYNRDQRNKEEKYTKRYIMRGKITNLII